MALYVAVCLLAALTAADEGAEHGHVRVLGLVWGVSIGLALAHVFAFRVSARLVAAGRIEAHDAVRWVLALWIALVGYLVAHQSGASRSHSVLYGIATLVLAGTIALVNNVLSGH